MHVSRASSCNVHVTVGGAPASHLIAGSQCGVVQSELSVLVHGVSQKRATSTLLVLLSRRAHSLVRCVSLRSVLYCRLCYHYQHSCLAITIVFSLNNEAFPTHTYTT